MSDNLDVLTAARTLLGTEDLGLTKEMRNHINDLFELADWDVTCMGHLTQAGHVGSPDDPFRVILEAIVKFGDGG